MPKRKSRFNSPIAPLPAPEEVKAEDVLAAFQKGECDIVCVVGPTASGKTRYAVSLAREFNTIVGREVVEIISADSRQVYRGMDIGTGKDLGEYGEIPYHLIDIVDAGEEYNVYKYQADFAKCYSEIISRGGIPILSGGSGLYIQAAVESFFNLNGRRLRPYYIGVLVSRAERVARIDARLDARLQEGLIEEVRGLLDRGVPEETLIRYGLEYKYVTLYIQGVLTYDEMRTQLAYEIHRFAKRQMTWLRRIERSGGVIHWVTF